VGRPRPGPRFPHDIERSQALAERWRDQDMVQAPAVVLLVGLRKAVAPPGVAWFRLRNEKARHVDQAARCPEAPEVLGLQRGMPDAAAQALVIPHIVLQWRDVLDRPRPPPCGPPGPQPRPRRRSR